jgi:hypothetical protein
MWVCLPLRVTEVTILALIFFFVRVVGMWVCLPLRVTEVTTEVTILALKFIFCKSSGGGWVSNVKRHRGDNFGPDFFFCKSRGN